LVNTATLRLANSTFIDIPSGVTQLIRAASSSSIVVENCRFIGIPATVLEANGATIRAENSLFLKNTGPQVASSKTSGTIILNNCRFVDNSKVITINGASSQAVGNKFHVPLSGALFDCTSVQQFNYSDNIFCGPSVANLDNPNCPTQVRRNATFFDSCQICNGDDSDLSNYFL